MRLGTASRRRTRPSLIPLIDVMLVLLFFFMLANSYVRYGRTPLQIAPGGRAGGVAELDVVSAQVMPDGRIAIGDALFSPELAARELREAKDVRLAPAPGVTLQTLLAGWQQLTAQGIKAQLAEGAP